MGSVPHAVSALLADQSDSGPNDGITSNPGHSVRYAVVAFASSLTETCRTYGISQRCPWVGRTLIVAYILATGVSSLRPRCDVSHSDLK